MKDKETNDEVIKELQKKLKKLSHEELRKYLLGNRNWRIFKQ